MSFLAPYVLLGLVLVPVAIGLQARALRRRAARRAELAATGLVLSSPRRLRRMQHLPFALFVVALTLMIVGTARPQANLGIPRKEGTVVLAFDTSNSMLATDLEPSRMEAAKTAARTFVEKQPKEIRIGVVSFGDGAAVLQTPTWERPDVLAAIDRLHAGGGTSVGQGLFAALGAIAEKPLEFNPEALNSESGEVDLGYFGSAAIVLLSDGENTGPPDPLAVAKLASLAGTSVHTVGLGSEAGTVVEIDGFSVATALDVGLLTQVAEATGGTYSGAEDSEALKKVYESLDLRFVREGPPTELTALFGAVGGLVALVAAALSLGWFGRVV